ncbi:MAG: hypothetical protein H9Q65_03125, partial [Spiroplasma ixodetis]|nr:hypothetical protein [Spiroplasma ixodetis]
MKNLLSMLAVSTLVGTSASNLNPVFTNATVNHGFKSNKLKNQDISIKNKNNTNPFIPKQLPSLNEQGISSFAVDSNDNIYAGTNDGLYKSTDGINFKQVNDKINSSVNDITIQNKIIYVSTNNDGLWKSTDGINFKQVNKQNYIRCLAVDSNDNIYAGTTSYGLLKSTDGGNYFSRIDNNIKMDFVNKIIFDHHNNIWVACDNGLYKSTDGINFEQVKVVLNTFSITSIAITIDGKIYAGTKWKGLYKSTDGINFNKINTINNSIITGILITKKLDIYVSTNGDGLWKSNGKGAFDKINESPNNIMFNSLVVTSSNVVYMGTYKGNGGIWTINLIEQLIKVNKPDNFDKSWLLYSGIVYNSAQKIDIKENLVASATLDGKSQTVPKIGLDIPVGEHNLILTLKDKTLASVFGGEPNTGQVTYKLWVKTSIDKNKIDYQTKIDDTQLYTGLVSNTGNTKSKDIIQTKIKDGTGTHNASINLSLNDNLIDFDVNKSFYEQGTVDSSNNFIENPSSKKTVSQNLSITTDGIYHLHLEDTVGNIYDSYLELGESNWKLKGTFNDSELDKLKTKLNVTVNITDPSQKAKALGWLHQYENFVENKFNETIKTNGKGFDSEIKKQITSYTAFLKPLIYDISNEPKFDDGLDKDLLVKTITDKAKEILNKGLDELPKNLNVNTSNVVNKSTLDSYSIWIKG